MIARRTATEVLTVSGQDYESAIARAAQLLRDGRLVAFPTETVYGLGANALDSEAVAGIYEAKGRPAINPVIVHVPDAASAQALVTDWPEAAARLAAEFWPGPLTLVLPKSRPIPDIVTAGGPTVAVRVPAHPIALALLIAAGIPVAAPSANRSTELSPTTARHVLQSMNGRIDLVLDGGPTSGGIESTVLSLAGGEPRLLRPGLITPEQIERVIGPILRPSGPINDPEGPGGAPALRADTDVSLPGTLRSTQGSALHPLASPGMLARHYAPRARLEVAADAERRIRELLADGRKVGWLTRLPPPVEFQDDLRLVIVTMPSEPRAYAVHLYATLHDLDDLGVTNIVADVLPPTDDWLAVRDRLTRASTPAA